MQFQCMAFAFAVCAATSVQASCTGPGTPLFTCTFKGSSKQVNVCLQDNVVLYSYGSTGQAPELLLGRDVERVGYTPWNGIGRSIWEEISLSSGEFSYDLSYAIERAPDGELPMGHLRVMRGDSALADLQCDVGSVDIHDFYPLFEAKEASGQRFCLETGLWGAGC